MIAILKREWKAYFDNMLGYVMTAALLALFGYFFVGYNIEQGYPFFAYALVGMLMFFVIVVPLLTMRSLAEERKSKTDQLLLTAPVSVTQIVLGKFLAMVGVFAVPVLLSCAYPVVIYITAGSAHFINDYAALLAFFLIGVSYLSIGMFLSSVTESQIIAAILTFGALFLLQNMTQISEFIPKSEGKNALIFVGVALVFAIILYKLTQNVYASFVVFAILTIAIAVGYVTDKSIFYNLAATILKAIPYEGTIVSFIYSVFDLSAVVTYLSVTTFFVFLTVQSIQKRRYS